METEEGEFVVEGFHGSSEDAKFDELVGTIEDFMISYDIDDALKRLLPSKPLDNDHERHTLYRKLIEEVEKAMDTYVLKHCSSFSKMEDVALLLESRKEEISEEVWQFATEGCFDYPTFVEKLEELEKKK